MKIKKQVAESVNQDLKEAAFWYNQARQGLGILFLKEIKEQVNQITEILLLMKFVMQTFV